MISFTADKFGFYQIGDYKTYSKLEALELQKSTNKFPEWNFNRPVLDKVNWKVEPKSELWFMYQERCRQIRENYDYVVLFYSGGSDSFNMLEAWEASGCKIDEVATFCNQDASKNKFDLMNSEINLVVLDHIKTLQDRGVDFHFRLIDISQITLDAIDETVDSIYIMNNVFAPHRMATSILRSKIRAYADIIASGRRLCFVWGQDKPQMFFDQAHYVQFFDIMDNCVNSLVQQNYTKGWYDELFYWTPDFPEIIVKQAHIIKRFLEICDDVNFYQDTPTSCGYNPRIKKYLTANAQRRLIYPTWDTATFSSGKTPNKIYSVRDQWLWNSNLSERDVVVDKIELLLRSVDQYWLNDPDNRYKGIKRHASPKYYI